MSEKEAIEKANRFLLADQGINAQPVQVVSVSRPNQPSFWLVRYGPSILHPKETAAGTVVDDGDYILRVDDATGTVTARS